MNNQTQLILDFIGAKKDQLDWQKDAEKAIANGTFDSNFADVLNRREENYQETLKALRDMPRVADQLEYHLFGTTYATLILQGGEVVDVETTQKEIDGREFLEYLIVEFPLDEEPVE